MSNYANLKSAIQSVIKTNGNNEITGQLLQTELLAMITTLGYGYQFMGVASPDTVPGTPDAKVFYIAYTPGTYTNFNGIAVTGLCVLKYATGWVKEDIPVSGGGGGTEFTVEPTDLTLQSGTPAKLKFADRLRESNITTGKNYIILRETATFAQQVSVANCIYEIRYDFSIDANFTLPGNSVLFFNGGKLYGDGLLSLNGAYLFGNVQILNEPYWDQTNEFIEGYKPSNMELPVSWFGAKGDGVTDDAPALIRTIKWLRKDGAKMIFDKNATYILGDGINDDPSDTQKTKHTGYSYPEDYALLTNDWTGIDDKESYIRQNPVNIGRCITLNFFKFKNLKIDGNGSTIKSHSNNGYARNNAIFWFWLCKNFTMSNITIDANRENRMEIYKAPYWSDASYGPTIVNYSDLLAAQSLYSYLQGDATWSGVTLPREIFSGNRLVYSFNCYCCSDFTLDGVNSINGIVDGLAINNAENKRIKIKNCLFAHNQRHGIWLGTCNDVVIDSCRFEYAGYKQDDVTVMYMSGNDGACGHIDCENGNDTILSRNNTIKNCAFIKSAKNGIILSRGFENSKILHSNFDGCSIYSYSGRSCFNNEIGFNTFNVGTGNAFHQEGMNFHHNIIDILIEDTATHDIANYSRTYSDTYIKGNESELCSVVQSRFCNNVIRIDYGVTITSENRNTSCRFYVTDNMIMRNNVFCNFDFSESGSGGFRASVKDFSDNVFIYDTAKYSWLQNVDAKIATTGYTKRNTIKVSNFQSSRSAVDIERRSTEIVARICNRYASSSRYMIIKHLLRNATIKIFVYGNASSSPTLFREYFIHDGYSSIASGKSIWFRDLYSPGANNQGGLRSDFNGVFELDTKIANSGIYYFIEIRIPLTGSELLTEDLISQQSGQYSFTGTVYNAINMSRWQSTLPTLGNPQRGQFDGETVFDETNRKLFIKNLTSFVDYDGYTPGPGFGTTTNRPTLTANDVGYRYFDTDLNKPIWFNGTGWVDATGTTV